MPEFAQPDQHLYVLLIVPRRVLRYLEVHHVFSITTPHFRGLRHVLLNPKTDSEKNKAATAYRR